jgi:hypothetical protein
MLNRCLSLVALALLVGTGCNKGTTDPSKPSAGGTTIPDTAHLGNKIEIVGSPIRVEKGKTAKMTITATRKDPDAKETRKETVMYKESWYQGDIQLEFDTSDATGLKIDPAVIPAGKDSVEVTVTAAADATSGMVSITGKGKGAEPFTILVRADVR